MVVIIILNTDFQSFRHPIYTVSLFHNKHAYMLSDKVHLFKVMGKPFRGSNSAIFIFASLHKGGLLFQEKNFFPLRADPHLE